MDTNISIVVQQPSGSFSSTDSFAVGDVDVKRLENISLSNEDRLAIGDAELCITNKKIVFNIGSLFESWQPWQKRVLFSGLINRFKKPQLKNLLMAVESVFHRDFYANLKEVYPMRKVKAAISPAVPLLSEKIPKHESILPEIVVTDDENKIKKRKVPAADLHQSKMNYIPSTQKQKNKTDNLSVLSDHSVWSMGQSSSWFDDNVSDFQSRVTPLPVLENDFFASRPSVLGCYVTTQTKAGSQYMTKFDTNKNKLPFPLSKQLYKNEKFWSSNHLIADAKPQRLKELFSKQLAQIWKWLDKWEEFRKVRLLLHLLEKSDSATVKFVADNLKYKLAENADAGKTLYALPESCWLKIFNNLDARDIAKAGQVCRSWYSLMYSDSLWRNKCDELGLQYDIPNLSKIIETFAGENEILDWKQAYVEFNKRLIEMKKNKEKRNSLGEVKESEDKNFEDVFGEVYGKFVSRKELYEIDRARMLYAASSRSVRRLNQAQDEKSEQYWHDQFFPKLNHNFVSFWKMHGYKKNGSSAKHHRHINQKRLSVLPSHSERCIIIEVGKELLTELDEFSAIQKGHHVAIDFQEILPQEGTSQTWMHGEVIPVKLVKCLEGHEGPVLSVLAHGIRIFSGGLDQRIKLWDSAGQCYGRMDHHLKGGVLDMAIGADEKCRTLYSGSWDLNVTAWDSITFRRIDVLVGHTDTVSAVEVDSRFVVSASHDGTIRVWSVRTHKCERVIKHHTGAVLCLTFNHRRIISGGADKLVLLIDPETGKLLKKFEGHKTAVTAVQNRQDLIISGDRDGNVFFWSLCGDGKPEDSMKAHNGQINGIAFYQTRFFTVSNDKLVKEWDLLTLRCVRILQGHTDAVTDIKWNSHYLVTCSRDGSVRLWMWDFIEDN